MKYNIMGSNLQVVIVEIAPGEGLYAEAGALNHMSGNMNMTARNRGGIMKGIGRMFAGESFFLTEFQPMGGPGTVAFAGNLPGKILAIPISPGRDFMAQKDAFLAAQDSVEMSVAFTKKLGAGFFGGEGFILERFSGNGLVFIHVPGDLVEYNLAPGQMLEVSTGAVAGFEATVSYDIQRVGNIKTMLFGGEGVFVTTLTGPGKVYIQSMTAQKLANALIPYMPPSSSSGSTISFG
jgi:uncharacterized protein (TIGR00266 family)